MEGNAIEEFPVEVGEWTEMQGMNLSNNKLTTFPVGIFNMKQLTYLDLSGNNITGNFLNVFIHYIEILTHISYPSIEELVVFLWTSFIKENDRISLYLLVLSRKKYYYITLFFLEIDVDRLYTSLPNLTQLMLIGNPVAETMKTELENHEKKPKTLKLLLV